MSQTTISPDSVWTAYSGFGEVRAKTNYDYARAQELTEIYNQDPLGNVKDTKLPLVNNNTVSTQFYQPGTGWAPGAKKLVTTRHFSRAGRPRTSDIGPAPPPDCSRRLPQGVAMSPNVPYPSPPSSQSHRLIVIDGDCWAVNEEPAPTVEGAYRKVLTFDNRSEIRRCAHYPQQWSSLKSEALAALLPGKR